MKNDFIALSWAGLFGAVFCGFLLGEAYKDRDIMYVLLATLMFLVVYGDARSKFETGSYQLGWFAWSRVDDCPQDTTEPSNG